MEFVEFVSRIRDHYLDQFRAFTEAQRHACRRGASEVEVALGSDAQLFRNLCCIDFVRNDGPAEAIELEPESILTFPPVSGSFGPAMLLVDHLRWDDVLVRHDAELAPREFDFWFERWFDPDREPRPSTDEPSARIHSLVLGRNIVAVDFGTAEAQAFHDLIALLAGAGATSIHVSSANAEVELK